MNKEKNELKNLNAAQIKEKIESYRRELFSLRLTSATSHIKDNSQFNKLRKNIARALTFLNNSDAQKFTR